jgi:cytidylate kinase
MNGETALVHARRVAAEAEDRIGLQQLLIVRLRDEGADATRAAQLLDEMNDALHLARDRLAREEAVDRVSLWLQGPPTAATQ